MILLLPKTAETSRAHNTAVLYQRGGGGADGIHAAGACGGGDGDC